MLCPKIQGMLKRGKLLQSGTAFASSAICIAMHMLQALHACCKHAYSTSGKATTLAVVVRRNVVHWTRLDPLGILELVKCMICWPVWLATTSHLFGMCVAGRARLAQSPPLPRGSKLVFWTSFLQTTSSASFGFRTRALARKTRAWLRKPALCIANLQREVSKARRIL